MRFLSQVKTKEIINKSLIPTFGLLSIVIITSTITRLFYKMLNFVKSYDFVSIHTTLLPQ